MPNAEGGAEAVGMAKNELLSNIVFASACRDGWPSLAGGAAVTG